jgi:hypothetical protein
MSQQAQQNEPPLHDPLLIYHRTSKTRSCKKNSAVIRGWRWKPRPLIQKWLELGYQENAFLKPP